MIGRQRVFGVMAMAVMTAQLLSAAGPQPGDVYREFKVNLKVKNNWRVTDPNAPNQGAKKFLPNPVLSIDLADLKNAKKAEVLIDRWGGHPGTSNKRVRVSATTLRARRRIVGAS